MTRRTGALTAIFMLTAMTAACASLDLRREQAVAGASIVQERIAGAEQTLAILRNDYKLTAEQHQLVSEKLAAVHEAGDAFTAACQRWWAGHPAPAEYRTLLRAVDALTGTVIAEVPYSGPTARLLEEIVQIQRAILAVVPVLTAGDPAA